MRTMWAFGFGIVSAISLLGSVEVSAQIVGDKNLEYTVTRGKTIPIAAWGILDYSTCTARGAPGLSINKAPILGAVTKALLGSL
jgi:hypothetical protein